MDTEDTSEEQPTPESVDAPGVESVAVAAGYDQATGSFTA